MHIQAIETTYKGYHFRSRLEARWAVFFDTLEIPWQYEPQGYMVGAEFVDHDPRRPYLPDFYLPNFDLFVEVKGDPDSIDWTLLGDACDGWGSNLGNTRGMHDISKSTDSVHGGAILVLGEIPDPFVRWAHPFLFNRKGVSACYVEFVEDFFFEKTSREFSTIEIRNRFETNARYDTTWGDTGIDTLSNLHFKNDVEMHGVPLSKYYANKRDRTIYHNETFDKVANAYKTARSARFEHGQNGASL